MTRSSALVAVINSQKELLDLFGEFIEDLGMNAVTFRQSPPISEVTSLISFLTAKQPDVIMFDVAPPYEEDWRACEQVHAHFANVPLIVVTTSPQEVKDFVQDVTILEKPFFENDMAVVLHNALASRESTAFFSNPSE